MDPGPSRPFTSGPGFEQRLLRDAWLAVLPGLLAAGALLWSRGRPDATTWLLAAVVLLATLVLVLRLRRRAVFPLHTLSNLLEALREGDYSLRGSRARRGDAVGDVVWEVNALAQTLREQRLQVQETSALLAKVIAAMDIAIFSFDEHQRLRLLNRAGERLLGRTQAQAVGRSADELGLDDCLRAEGGSLVSRRFAGASGRFELRRFRFREDGRPHELLVVADLSRALREQEQRAWQRLVRVLGHELNNSLTPIKSMASTLDSLLGREPLAPDWRDDTRGGLQVIAGRAEALNRFLQGYALLARLPPPQPREVDLPALLQRVAALEQRLPVQVQAAPGLVAMADPDQLEQALINLVRNAVEASLPEQGGVRLRATAGADWLRIEVLDEGLGLAGSDNLFVPFFTTKPGGSGIGLALARQIAEGHGGRLDLENRRDRRGCVAWLELPRA